MKKPVYQSLDPDLLLDCSQEDQINFWAEIFKVTPQVIKTAVRACCNNNIACISDYLKNGYQASKQYQQKTSSNALN